MTQKEIIEVATAEFHKLRPIPNKTLTTLKSRWSFAPVVIYLSKGVYYGMQCTCSVRYLCQKQNLIVQGVCSVTMECTQRLRISVKRCNTCFAAPLHKPRDNDPNQNSYYDTQMSGKRTRAIRKYSSFCDLIQSNGLTFEWLRHAIVIKLSNNALQWFNLFHNILHVPWQWVFLISTLGWNII
jgi:hypothetical protein